MLRGLILILATAFFWLPRSVMGQDDGPPIAITSPDVGTTFAYGTIKDHQLIWNGSQQVLIARVTFTDAEQSNGTPSDDTHEFRLPGIRFDAAKGLFTATSARGEVIPVARIRKTLFIKSIETLPNARVRIIHPRGVISVILEAISPKDPAMHPATPSGETDSGA